MFLFFPLGSHTQTNTHPSLINKLTVGPRRSLKGYECLNGKNKGSLTMFRATNDIQSWGGARDSSKKYRGNKCVRSRMLEHQGKIDVFLCVLFAVWLGVAWYLYHFVSLKWKKIVTRYLDEIVKSKLRTPEPCQPGLLLTSNAWPRSSIAVKQRRGVKQRVLRCHCSDQDVLDALQLVGGGQ